MAKRLIDLRIDHEDAENRASEKYWQFGTRSGVQYIQKKFERAIRNEKKKKTIKLYTDALDTLRQTVQKQELDFYKEMNLPTNPKLALTELQKRIDEWNSSGANKILGIQVADEIFKLINFDYDQLSDTLERAFFDDEAAGLLLQSNEGQEAIRSAIIKEINNIAETNSKQKFSTSSKRGLLKYMHVVTVGNNQVKIKFDDNTPAHYGRRIVSLMRKYSDYEVDEGYIKETPESLREKILGILKNRGIDEKALRYMREPLFNSDFISVYGFHSNLSAIKGALAEVYWNATFRFLTKQEFVKGQIIPTGFIRDAKKQINVDMVLKGYGFQIKSYTLKNNTIEFKDSNKQIGVLLRDRAEVEGSLLETLLNFFASWSYNQVNMDYENAEKDYGPTFAQFQQLAPGVEQVLKSHLYKILGIQKTMRDDSAPKQLEKYLNLNEGYYRNTFFLINDKIVPSSQILLALKEVLNKEITPDAAKILFSASVTAPETPKSAAVWPNGLRRIEEDKFTYANRTRANYSIKIKLADILEEAYKICDF